MSRRRKLEKFEEIRQLPNVVENLHFDQPGLRWKSEELIDFRGQWSSLFFQNDQDIVLELGCGRGEYVVAMGAKYPEKNFLGIDLKGNRIWKGACFAQAEGLSNVGFLRSRIEPITHFFQPSEIDEIWITFPDPHPREKRALRRLTSPLFLEMYMKLLKPNGYIHLKTDEANLYAYTLKTWQSFEDVDVIIHSDDIDRDAKELPEELAIRTRYETIHRNLGTSIKYIRAAKK